jgi:hypothetical protein
MRKRDSAVNLLDGQRQVCKAESQHRAGFEGVARKFIDVDAPGLATQVLSRLPYSGPVFVDTAAKQQRDYDACVAQAKAAPSAAPSPSPTKP